MICRSRPRAQGVEKMLEFSYRVLFYAWLAPNDAPRCTGSPEGGLQMAHRYGPESLEHEVADLREKQKQLLSALRLLFDLLEEYAPSWYTEEHHTKALAALRLQP
jgi:hypothetical protein